MNRFDIYLMNDQPTTCPICGIRTEIILEFSVSQMVIQYHKCLSVNCEYSFIVEEDN